MTSPDVFFYTGRGIEGKGVRALARAFRADRIRAATIYAFRSPPPRPAGAPKTGDNVLVSLDLADTLFAVLHGEEAEHVIPDGFRALPGDGDFDLKAYLEREKSLPLIVQMVTAQEALGVLRYCVATRRTRIPVWARRLTA